MKNNDVSSITSLSSLKMANPNIKDPTTKGDGGFYLGQMTTAQRDELTLIQNGTIIYNITEATAQMFVGRTDVAVGNWANMDPEEVTAFSAQAGTVLQVLGYNPNTKHLVYANATVEVREVADRNIQLFKVQDGELVAVNAHEYLLSAFAEDNDNTLPTSVTSTTLSGLEYLLFTNSTGNQNVGMIFVDSLMAQQYLSNSYNVGGDEQVATLITGGLPSSSTLPTALLELQSTTGALMLSRMNTLQAKAVVPDGNPAGNGMMLYNTLTQQFQGYRNSLWQDFVMANAISGNVTLTGELNAPSAFIPGRVNSNNNVTTRSLVTTSTDPIPTWTSASALLELASTTSALLLSRMTTTQMNALVAPVAGMIIYNTTTNIFMCYQNASWLPLVNAITSPTSSGITITGTAAAPQVNLPWVTSYNANLLMVNSSVYINTGNAGSYSTGSNGKSYTWDGAFDLSPGTFAYSLLTNGNIISSNYYVFSSKNLKNIVAQNDLTSEITSIFKKLSVVQYEYKDKIQNPEGKHYGVIAESVAEILPNIVTDMFVFAPNIMQKGELHIENHQTYINIPSADLSKFLAEDYKAEKIRIIINNEFLDAKILNIIENKIFITDIEDASELLATYESKNDIFVYGTEENCPVVDKERLFEMNIAVTQSLLTRVEKLESLLAMRLKG